MLSDLKILNGDLELIFNQYTYEYTVVVNEETDSLEFDYNLEDNCYVDIRNNELKNEENIVYLDFFNGNDLITYTFYVYKNNTSLVNGIDTYMKSLEVQNSNEIDIVKVQILMVSIFLLLIITFSIIFKRKKVLK